MSWYAAKLALALLLLSVSGDVTSVIGASGCSITGTSADEAIRGTPERDVICSLGGDDLIYGGGGNDRIIAGAGNDRIFGGAGRDDIISGSGADVVHGGSSDDWIGGGPGRDVLHGGQGHDVFQARDRGRDEIDGGRGRNQVLADAIDVVRRATRIAVLPAFEREDEGAYIVAAGADIACDPDNNDFENSKGDEDECRQRDTSNLVLAMRPDAVLIPGDHQYENATYEKYLRSFHPSWGRFKKLIRPAVGNHEYEDPAGDTRGYFRYYGASAGDPARAYYSFDLGAWHVIALNSECGHVEGGCGQDSPQDRWLRADLAANRSACTLAFFHRPRFSSGVHGNDAGMETFWRRLYEHGTEVILNGHDHNYERLAPVNPEGNRDEMGIRQFVVGMAGKNLRAFVAIHPASEARNATTMGVLKLTLRPKSYSWAFVSIGRTGFRDTGSDSCR